MLSSILQRAHLQLVQIRMEKQKKKVNKPKCYAKISITVRMKLVELVLQKSLPVRKASKNLSIKLSTAKLILKKYREDGTFFEKRADRLARLNTPREKQEFLNSSKHLVEVEPIFNLYNDTHLNTVPYSMNNNKYMRNLKDFPFINSSLYWNFFGNFPQANPYLNGNYNYHY